MKRTGNECPKCKGVDGVEIQYLKTPLMRNSLSRHDNETYICNLCGGAEAMMDYMNRDGSNGTKMTFDMARIAVENDYQEAVRLPPGMYWGSFYPQATGPEEENDDENS